MVDQKKETSGYFLEISIVSGCGDIRLKVSMVHSVSRLNAATFCGGHGTRQSGLTCTLDIRSSKAASRCALSARG